MTDRVADATAPGNLLLRAVLMLVQPHSPGTLTRSRCWTPEAVLPHSSSRAQSPWRPMAQICREFSIPLGRAT